LKKIMLIYCLLALYPATSFSQKKEDFYGPAMIQSFGSYTQGQTVSNNDIVYRLFIDRQCGLGISGRGEMRAALVGPWVGGIKREGCWYRTIDNGYVIVYRDGYIEKQLGYSTLLRVDLLDNGSGIVKQKKFDFMGAVKADADRRVREFENTVRTGIQ